MELPNIGKQCSVPDCKQLDFLPLVCTCKLFFCHKHFIEHIEHCPDRATQEKIIDTDKRIFSYVCSEPECNEKSIIPLICSNCKKHTCITHRHTIGTGCQAISERAVEEARQKCEAPKLQFQAAKALVDQQVDCSISNAKRKTKNLEIANKVQLMRLKGKAIGLKTIPVTDRVYFLVFNEKYCTDGVAVFISNSWTVGRCIDAIADLCKIPNNNHKINAQKLRLFKKADANAIIISTDTSVKISDLLVSEFIVNGDSLIMEYIV